MGLQKEQLLQVIDAATVSWPAGKKRPKTRQHTQLTTLGALDVVATNLTHEQEQKLKEAFA